MRAMPSVSSVPSSPVGPAPTSAAETHARTPARRATAARRRAREKDILAATRTLFDARGVRDAQIEDIARAVGINRAIIYRHFSGKEELFALTLVGYLAELEEQLVAASAEAGGPTDRVRAIAASFADFGLAYPAFVDCTQTLLRRPWAELSAEISEGALYRLGRGMAACLRTLSAALTDGVAADAFSIADVDELANTMYASALGALQLARLGMVVKEAAPGVPTTSRLSPDQVKASIVAASVAMASARR